MLLFVCTVLLPLAAGQGQRCTISTDCTSEYAPYCSKWGWCVWTSLYGDKGPPQSYGAEEDGERGQCRDDSDCTRWASVCSPLGFCRSGFWDGSFGSPSNPRPGQEPSEWIKKNAGKPGAVRNNVKQSTPRSQPDQPRSSQNKPETQGYQEQINEGKIPGEAGKDYPTFSLSSLRGKHSNIKPAPADKIPKDYPKPTKGGAQGSSVEVRGGGGGCPGSLEECMANCPSELKIFQACAASCGNRCD